MLALPWSGRYAFEDADFQDWSVDGDDGSGTGTEGPAGQVKGDGLDLTFVRVLGAGHMVPMDRPAAALRMITAFTRGERIAKGVNGAGAAVAAVA